MLCQFFALVFVSGSVSITALDDTQPTLFVEDVLSFCAAVWGRRPRNLHEALVVRVLWGTGG